MTIRLHDTATREVRDFVPLEEGRAGIYVCGLTVQGEPHVGHVRSAVSFDVLRRWLTHRGYDVTLIRNVTDIDDKILAKAAEEDRAWFNLAFDMHRELTRALAAINVLPPTYEPLATGHVPEMLELIGELVERGHAYPAADGSGDVYFDVRSWPAYGELTRQRIDDMEAAGDADPDQASRKRDPRDFALWKGRAGEGEPATASWPSPWGRGRPGWHIECSAMAGKYLGAGFDIHGGGVDLRFPHHENEQAQSRAAGRSFAAYWLHNAWITTAGEKMSKSLGNSLAVPSVLERVRGVELRYYLLAAHYRSHVEFSFEALDEAAAAYRRIEAFVARAVTGAWYGGGREVPGFAAAMDDDLGTPAAVAALHDAVREGNRLLDAGETEAAEQVGIGVVIALSVLGLQAADFPDATRADERLTTAVDVLVAGQLDERSAARAAQDWPRADAVRDRLRLAGIEVEDTPDGPKWSLSDAR